MASVLANGMILRGKRIHLVGAKGTGMAALAEILFHRGAELTGSDVSEIFQTQEILDSIGLDTTIDFSAEDLPSDIDWVIHSAAYDKRINPQLVAANEHGIKISSYPEALGDLSKTATSVAISGVHGKTTTAAICGLLVKALDLPGTVLTATGIPNLGGKSTTICGDSYFIAETCEYRRHFNNFDSSHLVVTSVELEHVDVFPSYESVLKAFCDFGIALRAGGSLIFCADDKGAAEVAANVSSSRPDVKLCSYGESAIGPLQISNIDLMSGETEFQLNCLSDSVLLKVPGRHNVYNAAAAVGVIDILLKEEGRVFDVAVQKEIVHALEQYKGGKRRTEIVGQVGNIIIIDDYAHHPTELVTTLSGLRAFYPNRRLVVSFMSHTLSRTTALLSDFAVAFEAADEVILHPIYASARENKSLQNARGSKALFHAVESCHPRVLYFKTMFSACSYLANSLNQDDLLVTMGAGDNWQLGRLVLDQLRKMSDTRSQK